MNENEGQHDCPDRGYEFVPLGKIAPDETIRAADRATGADGRFTSAS